LTTDSHFHDTWHMAAGVQYRITPAWLVSTGLAFDSSPVSKFYRTPAMPVDEQFRWGVGLQYDVNDAVTVGAAYEFLDFGEGELNVARGPLAGRVQGDYSSNHAHFAALNVVWKFH